MQGRGAEQNGLEVERRVWLVDQKREVTYRFDYRVGRGDAVAMYNVRYLYLLP